MRKIIAFTASLVFILILSACGSTSSDVTLLSLSDNVLSNSKIMPATNDNEEDLDLEDGDIADLLVEYQYKIIDTSTSNINIKIELDNPKNLYIYDFTMVSSCDNLEILIVDGNGYGEYKKLNDQPSIRWNGGDNFSYTIQLKLGSIEDTSLEITNLYYSDRTDGSNKETANLNNKEHFNIFFYNELELSFGSFNGEELVVNLKNTERVTFLIDEDDENVLLSENKSTLTFTKVEGNYDLQWEVEIGDIVIDYSCGLDDIYLRLFNSKASGNGSNSFVMYDCIFIYTAVFYDNLIDKIETIEVKINGDFEKTYVLEYNTGDYYRVKSSIDTSNISYLEIKINDNFTFDYYDINVK